MRPYSFAALAWLSASCFAACAHSQVQSTLVRADKPVEVYGTPSDPIKIRIGNGAAGATGILRALSEDYLAMSNAHYSIAWYQNISRLTLESLESGDIDIALTYERDQETQAISAGYAGQPTLVFNDHFIVVGPKSNPAAVLFSDSPRVVFDKIAGHGKKLNAPMFLSRNDGSATNFKEMGIWQSAGLHPWDGKQPSWYVTEEVFPRDALIEADKRGLYTIIDQGTWLSIRDRLTNSMVYTQGGTLLRNPCNALLGAAPSAEAKAFLAYLQSPRAQKLIADFGKAANGDAFFTPADRPDFEVLQK